jgi:ribosomal protein L7/L12
MTTVYDHIRLNAGLISAMPGRSTIMNTKITVEFSGNMQGLVEFLEATFKDPNALTLNVTVTHVTKQGKTPHEALADECMKYMTGTGPNAREELLKCLPAIITHTRSDNGKIPAIKAMRTVTNCGLKEGKDAVEGPIQNYIDQGGV